LTGRRLDQRECWLMIDHRQKYYPSDPHGGCMGRPLASIKCLVRHWHNIRQDEEALVCDRMRISREGMRTFIPEISRKPLTISLSNHRRFPAPACIDIKHCREPISWHSASIGALNRWKTFAVMSLYRCCYVWSSVTLAAPAHYCLQTRSFLHIDSMSTSTPLGKMLQTSDLHHL